VINRIQGKYTYKIKSSQTARECMSSSIGYRNDERIIAYIVMECDSNEKQIFKAGDNSVIDIATPA